MIIFASCEHTVPSSSTWSGHLLMGCGFIFFLLSMAEAWRRWCLHFEGDPEVKRPLKEWGKW